jgi:hypothetical protein
MGKEERKRSSGEMFDGPFGLVSRWRLPLLFILGVCLKIKTKYDKNVL